MNVKTIERNLKQFYCTSQYHKHLQPGMSPILISDGVKYVRDSLEAFWLLDAILSYQCDKEIRKIGFQKWILKQHNKDMSWELQCYDDEKIVVSQKIEYSSFPLPKIELWLLQNICILPGEY